MQDLPDVLSVQQVADLLGVCKNTVYKLCNTGDLPSFKFGNVRRIRKSAYLEWVKRMETGATS